MSWEKVQTEDICILLNRLVESESLTFAGRGFQRGTLFIEKNKFVDGVIVLKLDWYQLSPSQSSNLNEPLKLRSETPKSSNPKFSSSPVNNNWWWLLKRQAPYTRHQFHCSHVEKLKVQFLSTWTFENAWTHYFKCDWCAESYSLEIGIIRVRISSFLLTTWPQMKWSNEEMFRWSLGHMLKRDL